MPLTLEPGKERMRQRNVQINLTHESKISKLYTKFEQTDTFSVAKMEYIVPEIHAFQEKKSSSNLGR